VSIFLGILGFIFLSVPALGAVAGIVISWRKRLESSPLRWGATVVSLAAVVAENV
jgi:hypothetical protein